MEYLIIAIVVVVIAVAAVVGLVLPRRRRVEPPDGSSSTLELPAQRPSTAPPEESGTATPEAEAPQVEEAPAVEVPEPTAGRLVRLRSRLARSQSTMGKGLLAVLARDRLDEQAWEDVEDTLIGADVGVTATGEIVDRLRERTRVLGTR